MFVIANRPKSWWGGCVSFSARNLIGRGEGRVQSRMPLAGSDSGGAFTPMIVFVPCSTAECKGECDRDWLPRQCPGCGQRTVIWHGRRWRQAHDSSHDRILVRRGLCGGCHRTLNVLLGRVVPRRIEWWQRRRFGYRAVSCSFDVTAQRRAEHRGALTNGTRGRDS